MSIAPEVERLLERLEEATERLARMNPESFEELGRALADRQLALEALNLGVVPGTPAGREELAARLQADFDRAADVLVRLRLVRASRVEGMRKLSRERHLLQSLTGACGPAPALVDCQG